jgi:hypothetical protein
VSAGVQQTVNKRFTPKHNVWLEANGQGDENCPQDCPCDAPKQRLQSQRQPSRLFGELKGTEGFARKNDDGRNADRRLANHRLQPLGHLTAAGFPKYTPACGLRDVRSGLECPRNCPCQPRNPPRWQRSITPALASAEGSGSFVNEPSVELPEYQRVARLGQRPLLRRSKARGDSIAAAAVLGATISVHRFSEPVRPKLNQIVSDDNLRNAAEQVEEAAQTALIGTARESASGRGE